MIVASLLVLAGFLLAIFGVEFGKPTKEYRLFLPYVGGITEGTLVKFLGMDVGQVTEITLPEGNAAGIGITLEVHENTPIRTDSKAFVTSISLMADQHIEITAGSPHAALLPPHSVIASKEVLSFAQMAETLGELNNRTQVLVKRVSDIFDSTNRIHLRSVMGTVDTLLREGRKPLLTTVTNLEKASRQLAEMSADMKTVMDKNKGNLGDILTNLKTTTDATNKLVSQLQATVKNLESMSQSNNSNIAETVRNLQSATQNLAEFTRMLKEQPWLLVRKAAPPERKLP